MLLDHSAAGILAANRKGCRELADTGHFHVDLFGNYIPGLCAGLAIRVADLGQPLEPAVYPWLSLLWREGINGLYHRAAEYGFTAAGRYLSKCHLCLDMRKFLVVEKSMAATELQPREFYENVD